MPRKPSTPISAPMTLPLRSVTRSLTSPIDLLVEVVDRRLADELAGEEFVGLLLTEKLSGLVRSNWLCGLRRPVSAFIVGSDGIAEGGRPRAARRPWLRGSDS